MTMVGDVNFAIRFLIIAKAAIEWQQTGRLFSDLRSACNLGSSNHSSI